MMRTGIEAIHPAATFHRQLIVDACRREGLTCPQTAYLVATAHHESRLGLWLEDTSGRVEATRFRPRGHAPLTGRAQYRRFANLLDLPLLDRPDLAAEPKLAAEILVLGATKGWFTGRTLAEFVNATGIDYVAARQVMPSAARPIRVAGYARTFEADLEGVPYGSPTPSDVRMSQDRLRRIGWPVPVDGELGPCTRRAIRDFQAGYTFAELCPSGSPDPLTRLALDECSSADGHASDNFRFAEFRTDDSSQLSPTNRAIRIDRRLVLGLEQYRAAVGGPVAIASAYRSLGHHRSLGGRPGSPHLAGRAVHVRDPRMPVDEVRALGAFGSIGHRRGLAVHLGVGDGLDPASAVPEVYPLS